MPPPIFGYAGRAIMGTQVRIGDDECRTVPTGEVGEILIQGPHVMREYWRKPEATAETVVDGWLRSGDLGLQDAEGFLKVMIGPRTCSSRAASTCTRPRSRRPWRGWRASSIWP